jgi:putative endonuclease
VAVVYILYSKQIDKYYIGSCLSFEQRFSEHQQKAFEDCFTTKANDWIVYLSIEKLEYIKARKIEKHIKQMKSRNYIENLNNYKELIDKLVSRFSS